MALACHGPVQWAEASAAPCQYCRVMRHAHTYSRIVAALTPETPKCF